MSRPGLPDVSALEDLAAGLRSSAALPAALLELARLIVVRRSATWSERCAPDARAAGLSDRVLEAAEEEDWTDSALDERSRAVFRYALLFDAGHGVGESAFDDIAKQLEPGEIAELSLHCSIWGAIARIAIAFEH